MAKDTAFWEEVCNNFNYRFFSGVPFKEVNSLYWGMLSGKMHYIPAANEFMAAKMAIGAWIAGFKSGVLIHSSKLNDGLFSKLFDVPVLVITAGTVKKGIYSNTELIKVLDYIESKGKPGAFIYEEIYSS